MAIGAKDFIDKLLVEKYSQEKVDNHEDDAMVSRVSPEEMLAAMNTSANYYKNMLLINQRLAMVCYGVIAKSARYAQAEEVA